jgi:hypothetical protein
MDLFYFRALLEFGKTHLLKIEGNINPNFKIPNLKQIQNPKSKKPTGWQGLFRAFPDWLCYEKV